MCVCARLALQEGKKFVLRMRIADFGPRLAEQIRISLYNEIKDLGGEFRVTDDPKRVNVVRVKWVPNESIKEVTPRFKEMHRMLVLATNVVLWEGLTLWCDKNVTVLYVADTVWED